MRCCCSWSDTRGGYTGALRKRIIGSKGARVHDGADGIGAGRRCIATPTDAFRACRAGARYLTLFPASTYGIAHVKALLEVLRADAGMVAVGGVAPDEVTQWLAAGARGAGLGSGLYRAGDTPDSVFSKARAVVEALGQVRSA